ncbi:MAG: winged helix-turn-helix domain-containing protein [Fervidicoccaceae archaeon]
MPVGVCAPEGYKRFGGGVFAQASAPPRLGNRRGNVKRLAVLHVLASSTLPLSAREVALRAGMPLRTAQYYLKQLVEAGLVERRGARTVCVYAITPSGAVYLKRRRGLLRLRKNSGGARCSRVGAVRGDGVIDGVMAYCDGGSRSRLLVGGGVRVACGVVWQPMGGWWGELGLRVRWAPFRRVLEAVGVRLPRRRLRRVMFYVKNGVVHFDGVVAASQEEAELYGLWLLKERVVALVLLCFSILKWMGFERRFVDALWAAAPVLVVR